MILIAATGLVILLKLNSNHGWFGPYDLETWPMTLKNNSAPLLCYVKLCATSQSHRWIQTGVTVWKHPIRVKIGNFFVPYDLEIWWMTLTNKRAPLLCRIKLCASFLCHMWIQTGVMVQKWLNYVSTCVTLTFDLWPWHFAWTSLLSMVITPENLMMIQWWEHSEKGVKGVHRYRRTDGQTEGLNHS